MSLILAGIVAIGTVIVCLLMIGAAMMTDAPSTTDTADLLSTFLTGMAIAALLAASHWVGW